MTLTGVRPSCSIHASDAALLLVLFLFNRLVSLNIPQEIVFFHVYPYPLCLVHLSAVCPKGSAPVFSVYRLTFEDLFFSLFC